MTFAELGIPFPLFEAPVDECAHYRERGVCAACRREREHVFGLWEGGRLCDVAPADPDATDDGDAVVCYECLRAGKATFAKTTELGIVLSESAERGWLQPGQGRTSDDFPVVEINLRTHEERAPPETPYPPHERSVRWFAVRVPREHILELLRTPQFGGQDMWPFCCQSPAAFLRSVYREDEDDLDDDLADLIADMRREHGPRGCHRVYRCRKCDALLATRDTD